MSESARLLSGFDGDGISRLPVRRDLKDRRAAQATMREKNILAKRHTAARHVGIERNSTELAERSSLVAANCQRNQAWPRLRDANIKLARDFVTEIGCSHLRNG